MSKNQRIKQLEEQVAQLMKQLKPDSLTLTDPSDANITYQFVVSDDRLATVRNQKSCAEEITELNYYSHTN